MLDLLKGAGVAGHAGHPEAGHDGRRERVHRAAPESEENQRSEEMTRLLTPQVRTTIIALAVAIMGALVEALTGVLSAAGGAVPVP